MNKGLDKQPVDFSKSPQENKERFLSRGNIRELYELSDKERKQALDKSLSTEQRKQAVRALNRHADKMKKYAKITEELLKRQIAPQMRALTKALEPQTSLAKAMMQSQTSLAKALDIAPQMRALTKALEPQTSLAKAMMQSQTSLAKALDIAPQMRALTKALEPQTSLAKALMQSQTSLAKALDIAPQMRALTKALEPQTSLAKALDIAPQMRALTKALEPQTSLAKAIQSQMKVISQSVRLIHPLSEHIQKQIIQSYQFYKNKIKPEVLEILKKYNWTISPSLPMPLVLQLAKLNRIDKGKYRAINNLFVDFFSTNNWEQLEIFTQEWENYPRFRQRVPIIRDCINVLKSADNRTNAVNVVLPTLIAQIEGIWMDYLSEHGISRDELAKFSYRDKKNKLQEAMDITNPFDIQTSEILLGILFYTNNQNSPAPRRILGFNRNKILHGESKKYGRKDYLIKVFLLMDFLLRLK